MRVVARGAPFSIGGLEKSGGGVLGAGAPTTGTVMGGAATTAVTRTSDRSRGWVGDSQAVFKVTVATAKAASAMRFMVLPLLQSSASSGPAPGVSRWRLSRLRPRVGASRLIRQPGLATRR